MSKKIRFDYFWGSQADQYNFIKIPKALFQYECFRHLTCEAKMLYGLMLDRMSLSVRNQWFDEENRAFIYFQIEEVMEYINCGKNKAISCVAELCRTGLIEKKKQGFGQSNIIYVKTFTAEEMGPKKEEPEFTEEACGDQISPDPGLETGLLEVSKSNPTGLENKPEKFKKQTQEVPKINPNKTDFNNTKYIYNIYPQSFEQMWSVYPRKKDKGMAYRQYQARLKAGFSEDEIFRAVENYADECRRNRTEEKYIKHCATFLGASTPFVDYIGKAVTDDAGGDDCSLRLW